MNGDTKLKLRGGFYGAVFMLFITLLSFVFGYGVLSNRVEALEEKTDCITEINDRLARIETDVEWIRYGTEKKQKIKTGL